MLELWRSLFKQSNPSTLTSAGLIPNFTRPQPPPPLTRDGDGINGEMGLGLLSPNRASLAKGFDTLLGGDPRKNGGEATPDNVSSYREKNKTSETKV